jgi:hypothetical protein
MIAERRELLAQKEDLLAKRSGRIALALDCLRLDR